MTEKKRIEQILDNSFVAFYCLICLPYVFVILEIKRTFDHDIIEIILLWWFFCCLIIFSYWIIEFVYFVIRNKEKIAERVKDGHYQYENDKEGRKRLE